jgi:hypothetical protein
MRNAELLRQGRFSEIDAEHIAEEVKDMGASAKRELLNHLGVLLARLLKWQYQPGWHSKGWKYTIKEQRQRMTDYCRKTRAYGINYPPYSNRRMGMPC